jgi:hypothetical protein
VKRLATLLVVLVLAAAACGGDDDAPTATTTATSTSTTVADASGPGAKACADLKALGNLNADTKADAQAIADRPDVPDELRAAISDLIGLLGGDQSEAGKAQETMVQIRDLCAQYGTD